MTAYAQLTDVPRWSPWRRNVAMSVLALGFWMVLRSGNPHLSESVALESMRSGVELVTLTTGLLMGAASGERIATWVAQIRSARQKNVGGNLDGGAPPPQGGGE